MSYDKRGYIIKQAYPVIGIIYVLKVWNSMCS